MVRRAIGDALTLRGNARRSAQGYRGETGILEVEPGAVLVDAAMLREVPAFLRGLAKWPRRRLHSLRGGPALSLDDLATLERWFDRMGE